MPRKETVKIECGRRDSRRMADPATRCEGPAGGDRHGGWLGQPQGRRRAFRQPLRRPRLRRVCSMTIAASARAAASRGRTSIPGSQIADYRHMISFAETRPEIDADRIGIWGTSYAGGHVLVVGATDPRVKCVVSQLPTISGWRNTLRRFPGEAWPKFLEKLTKDRRETFKGAAPRTVPIDRALTMRN
jgi:hypothetical protein